MSTQLTDNTEYEFKVLYAISIIFIVVGHVGNCASIFPFSEIFPCYSFAITPFIFAAGYFYKEKYEQNVKEYIFQKFKKLIIPLYLWNFFYALITHIFHHFGFFPNNVINFKTLFISPLTSGFQFAIFLCSWFVFPLFLTYVINIILRKISSYFGFREKEYLFVLWALMAGCAAMILSNGHFNTGIHCLIIRTFLFIPFFEFGVLYRKYKQYDRLGNIPYFSTIVIIALILISIYGEMPIIRPGEGDISVTSKFWLMPYITGMLGTAFWLRISKILAPVIGKSKYINLIADNTYPIMMNNVFAIRVSFCIYPLLHMYTKLFSDFDMAEFKVQVWYHYSYNNLEQLYILNVIFAIVFSILLQKFFVCLKKLLIDNTRLSRMFPTLK